MKQKLLYYIAFGTFVIIMGIVYMHSTGEVTIKIADDADNQLVVTKPNVEQQETDIAHQEDDKKKTFFSACMWSCGKRRRI